MTDSPRAVLALDLGGTQIRSAAVLANGSLLGRASALTPLGRGPEPIYRACAALLDSVRASLPGPIASAISAAGVSSMGPVDSRRGLVVDPPNVPDLRDAPLAAELERRLQLPVYLERDTNVAALGEHWRGAARGCRDFLYVTVSTGLGGAIFRDGRLMLGPDGMAGELGHFTLEIDGPKCGCGGRGHLEAISSGSGLASQAQARAAESDFLTTRARLGRLTGKDVAEGELSGDETCRDLMARARRAFAIACVGWVDAFDPERIVVGGTLAERQGDRLLGPARDEVARTAFRAPASRVQILPAELGEDVGLVGAWPLVADRQR